MISKIHNADVDQIPEHSVCFETEGGRVFLAEFRTHGEALALARNATERLQRPVTIRRCGQDVQEVEPLAAGY